MIRQKYGKVVVSFLVLNLLCLGLYTGIYLLFNNNFLNFHQRLYIAENAILILIFQFILIITSIFFSMKNKKILFLTLLIHILIFISTIVFFHNTIQFINPY
jgi:hypothetical protein